jgi:hypothetical protein
MTRREVAEAVGCRTRYVSVVQEREQYRREGPNCRICGQYPEPLGPLLEDGRCLWCWVERDLGMRLLDWHQSGLFLAVLGPDCV